MFLHNKKRDMYVYGKQMERLGYKMVFTLQIVNLWK